MAGDDPFERILRSGSGGVSIRAKVVPGASRSRIVGLLGDQWLKVAVAALPQDGRANDALCRLLAAEFGVARRDVDVTEGLTRPQKTIVIAGLHVDDARKRLQNALDMKSGT